MVEIHLYGRLRRYGPTSEANVPCVLLAEPPRGAVSCEEYLASLSIPAEEVGNVFLDGRWRHGALQAELGEVRRIGLFPRNMSLLYV